MKKCRKTNEILFDKNKSSGSSKAKCCIIVNSNTLYLIQCFSLVIVIFNVNF